MKKICTLLAMNFLFFISIYCQENTSDELIEKAVESLDRDLNPDQDNSALVEELADRSIRQVNLNAAKEEELNTIPFLSPLQHKNLYDYLYNYGELFSIYELQTIPGFDSTLIRKIEPFITIRPKTNIPAPTPKNLLRFGHHDLLLRYKQSFPTAAGYLASDSEKVAKPGYYYPGTPGRYYFRYVYSWFDKLKIGFGGEKDPGEQFFKGAQSNGMDYYTGFISLQNIGALQNLTVGSYRIGFGQGLTLGYGLSLNSVAGFSTNPVNTSGIRPSVGMSEGSYLRGVAATFKFKPLIVSGFVSYHPRDATVLTVDSAKGEAAEIGSFITNGYHRTSLELSKKNTVNELLAGGNINISFTPTQKFGFRIGLTGVYTKYSAHLLLGSESYKQFGFSGNHNLNTGFDFQVRYRKLYLFGELSRSLNGGFAWITGINVNPDQRVTATMIVRNYQPAYQNLYSNAFGQYSLNSNEQGIFASINAAIHPKLNMAGFIDIFNAPWLRYRVSGPSQGEEYGVMLTWLTAGNVTIALRYFEKNGQINAPSESGQNIHKLISNATRSYRLAVVWSPQEKIMLKTRLDVKQANFTNGAGNYGYCIYQDFQYNSFHWISSLNLRFALFDIPNYDTRIYLYEPEVLYGYSVPAYQGNGIRGCLVLKVKLSRSLTFWARGGITFYSDRDEVGTGLELTRGNTRGELTGQVMLRL